MKFKQQWAFSTNHIAGAKQIMWGMKTYAQQTLRVNTVFYKCNNEANPPRGHQSVEGGWNAINNAIKMNVIISLRTSF